MAQQGFGGKWTESKLNVVEKYLRAYLRITTKYGFTTTYLDGFAGSGRNYGTSADKVGTRLFDDFEDEETEAFYRGSAYRALSVNDPSFDKYVFIESKLDYVEELNRLVAEAFPEKTAVVQVVKGDANAVIPEWCRQLRSDERALVFLDPYGMQVNWQTVRAIAETKKIDLWILVPLGQAIIRLLTKKTQPPEEWAAALTRFFGTPDWIEHFYVTQEKGSLFGSEEVAVRDVDFNRIVEYVVARLGSVFTDVLDTPVLLRNSKGIPIYLLCFAASNPRGAPTAVKIARDIARSLNDGR